MNQFFVTVYFIIMLIIGGGATLYLILALPATIIWKIYRCIKCGYKITD